MGNDTNNLSRKVFAGVLWKLLERFGMTAMSFVVGVVLARLLGPDAYGTIALLTIFISLSNVFVDSGFGSALVQKDSVTELDYNSVFYFSVGVSALLYGILFVSAPAIASFYGRPILTPVLRVLSITLIVNAVNIVQNAVLSRKMLFNLSLYISMSGTVTNGIVGISMALTGCGVWSLVIAQLSAAVVGTVVRWWLIAWRPKFLFSLRTLKPLFLYGYKLLLSSILDSFFSNFYGLIIGRVYSPADLALYNKGQSLPALAMDSVVGTVGAVSFPALSKMQHEKQRLKEAMRKLIGVTMLFLMPLMALVAAAASHIVLLLFGEAWSQSIIYVQLACVGLVLAPFSTINLQAMNAIGRSDVFLKLEIIKKGVSIVMLFVVCKYGVVAFALAGAVFSAPLGVLINAWPNRKLLHYGISEQVRDVLPTMAVACVVFGIAFAISFLGCNVWYSHVLVIGCQALVAAGIVYAYMWIFKPRALSILAVQLPVLRRLFRGI